MDKGLEEIQKRANIGYTMTIYGNRDNLHNQMIDDINYLIELNKWNYPSKNEYPEPYDLIISDRGIPYKVKEGFKITNLLTNGIENINSLKCWMYTPSN